MRKSVSLFTLLVSLSACGLQDPAIYNSYGASKGAGSVGMHTVLPGDTVYKVAKNYQLPMREIITLNHMEAPYVLNTGYRMKLPPPNEYEVREGDTVFSVAKMYETSPNRLSSLNSLQEPYKLNVGQILRLPAPNVPDVAVQNVSMANNSAAEIDQAQSARLNPVERESIENRTPVTSSGGMDNTASVNMSPQPQAQTQGQPAQVQEASATTRAKIPSDTPKMSGNAKFMRPVDGKIISNYGPKEDGLHNDGINIKAVSGTPVRAAENGVVVYNGSDLAGYGNLVLIRHEDKMMTAYAHLDKTLVTRGAKVTRGQSIGTVGSTGIVDGPQLHFEIRKGSTPLNPAKYL